MKNKLKDNKKMIALIALVVLIVILYFILFISTSSFNLFSPNQKELSKELSIEEVHERGGEVYYYGPDKIEVIYDPKHETPEQIEAMFKYYDEHPPEKNQ